MEVVCEATQSTNSQVRVAALQCLVKIMSLYYQYMEPYMGPALFPVNGVYHYCDFHTLGPWDPGIKKTLKSFCCLYKLGLSDPKVD